MDFTPKLAFVTGAWNHSFHALMQTKECVVAYVKKHDLFVLEGVQAWIDRPLVGGT
jgi:hypothetical protein